MTCSACTDNIFKEKLGRCQSCMIVNFVLFVGSAIGWYICYQSAPKQVATIALLFTLIGSGLLMALHIGAVIYYHYKVRL